MSKKPKKSDAKAELKLRNEIIEVSQAMSMSGLSPGRSGNVSARFNTGMLITPTGMAYEDLEPDRKSVV